MVSLAKKNLTAELHDLDWNFSGESGNDGIFGTHWYPARYLAQVPGILIGYLTEPKEIVLDPFCGSGTTLVEARRLGRVPKGIDTNPAATLMSNAKILAIEHDICNELRELQLELVATDSRSATILDSIPNLSENAKWYHPDTLLELASCWNVINATEGVVQVIGQACFSAILRFACSQDKHWGWICDNVTPRSFRYRAATKLLVERLADYSRFSSEMRSRFDISGSNTSESGAEFAELGDCARKLLARADASVDAIVTSPPYYGMTDYVRSQRLTFLWFDWDFDALRSTEAGARYKRKRQNSRGEYLDDMSSAFRQVSRVLKPGGWCAVVVGESPHRDPVLKDFELIIEECGLEVEIKLNRSVPVQRVMSPQLFGEEILIARRSTTRVLG